MGPFTVSKRINDFAYELELPKTWRAHNVFHVSLLKPFVSNGEEVDPISFTIQGGKPLEFEVERIYDFHPKAKHANTGKPRKVKELTFLIKWRGVREGVHAAQPYSNVKGTSEDALRDLAERWQLPPNQFSNPNNFLSDTWVTPNDRLPPPPARAAAI